MSLTTVHYQDLTNEGSGVFTFSLCWGEHWSKSMTELKADLVHEFGNEYTLVNMDTLSQKEYENLEARYASY